MGFRPISFMIESYLYGIYTILFILCVLILIVRRRPGFKIHLATLVVLFVITTIHIILEIVIAFKSPRESQMVYMALIKPTLKSPIWIAHKLTFLSANIIADALMIYRCYIIWNYRLSIIAFPIIVFIGTIVASFYHLLAFDIEKKPALLLLIGTTLFTNIVVTCLAASRIWWINRKAREVLAVELQSKYRNTIAIILESGLIYPAAILMFLFLKAFSLDVIPTLIAIMYQVVVISPTLIIVRVGLGIVTEDVGSTVEAFRMAQEQEKEPQLVKKELSVLDISRNWSYHSHASTLQARRTVRDSEVV